MKNYDRLMEMLLKANNIVALTGAGISTSADIPDFRSPKGVYADPSIDGERVFDINVFKEDPSIFGRFFSKLYPKIKNAVPTKGHLMLKKLEDMGKLKSIITQNIDGLHTKAGNKNIIEVHGHVREYVCIRSVHHRLKIEDVPEKQIDNAEPIICETCQAYMKPDVIFFGEYVKDLEKALTEIQRADLVLVMGTSLTVYPVAELPSYCSDNTKLIIINETETPYDHITDVLIRDNIDDIVTKIGLY
ncbi:MAG: SIR2 family NAD-dependent protein deacylase [Brevinema sp.]